MVQKVARLLSGASPLSQQEIARSLRKLKTNTLQHIDRIIGRIEKEERRATRTAKTKVAVRKRTQSQR